MCQAGERSFWECWPVRVFATRSEACDFIQQLAEWKKANRRKRTCPLDPDWEGQPKLDYAIHEVPFGAIECPTTSTAANMPEAN
jgi:predicted nucleotidyltransferase